MLLSSWDGGDSPWRYVSASNATPYLHVYKIPRLIAFHEERIPQFERLMLNPAINQLMYVPVRLHMGL